MAVRVAAGRTGGHQEQASWSSRYAGRTGCRQEQASWPSEWPQVGQDVVRSRPHGRQGGRR
jgi:hypothetical protein